MPLELLLLLNKEYVCEVNSNILMQAQCEKCGLTYYYIMPRHVKTSAIAWLHIAKARTERRAIEKAQRKLERIINQEAELVPCPQCYWISQSLVEGYGRKQSGSRELRMVLMGLGLSLSSGVAVVSNLALGMVLAVLSVLLVLMAGPIQLWIYRRRNYNRHWPQPPRDLSIDTPSALLQVVDEQGVETYEEVVASDPQLLDGSRKAIFKLGYFQWPPVCCQCLEPTDKLFTINRETDKLSLPFCQACSTQRSRRILNRLSLATLITALILGFVLMFPPAFVSMPNGRLFLVIGGLAAWVVYVVVYLGVAKRPFNWKWVNKIDGRFWVHTCNPQYNQMLQEYAVSTPQVIRYDHQEGVWVRETAPTPATAEPI